VGELDAWWIDGPGVTTFCEARYHGPLDSPLDFLRTRNIKRSFLSY
jgi:hypothetical protein